MGRVVLIGKARRVGMIGEIRGYMVTELIPNHRGGSKVFVPCVRLPSSFLLLVHFVDFSVLVQKLGISVIEADDLTELSASAAVVRVQLEMSLAWDSGDRPRRTKRRCKSKPSLILAARLTTGSPLT
jgi:hypothetical protein